MRYKVLIIDDNICILEALKELLLTENISVITAENGEKGIDLATKTKPDVIILDLLLPDISGHKVQRILKQDRTTSHIPILILTGTQVTEKDQVLCIENGACEYITKPFDNDVFIARLKNIFRWQDYKCKLKQTIKKYGLEINEDEHTIRIKHKLIKLTKIEFDLLYLLIKKCGQILKYTELLETIWGYGKNIDTRTLVSHISNLKKKLGSDYNIETVRSIGYRLTKYKYSS
ncbi:MAG TPA: DNA-binding response regulator [Elusimicrobia bacterium]|nr:DNA-binding response regulator [Elusimicrobiota bacterium]